MAGAVIGILRRDLILAVRRRTDVLTTLVFFVIVVSLFPLGVGPEMNLLRSMGPGVVWVAALLAAMMALSHLFAGDYADGTLEQMLLSPHPLTLLVAGKVAAQFREARSIVRALVRPDRCNSRLSGRHNLRAT